MFMITYLSLGLLLSSIVSAIINGTNSSYAFAAAIFQPALQGYSTPFICTGSLVSSHAVLTLAECVNGLGPSEMLVRLGQAPDTYVNRTVNKVTFHPDFSISSLEGDVAVLHLKDPIKDIQPVEMASSQTNESCVHLVGWGATENRTQALSPSLHSLSVDTISQPNCAIALKSCFNLTSQHFCTLVTKTGGEAYGDSGGPILDEYGKLIGLISGNPECAGPNSLALQVNILKFKDWIQNQLS